MQIGVDSFASIISGSGPVLSPAERVANLLEEAETADRVGVDVFGIGEHHRAEFIESAPSVLLAAVAARTRTFRVIGLLADDALRLRAELNRRPPEPRSMMERWYLVKWEVSRRLRRFIGT